MKTLFTLLLITISLNFSYAQAETCDCKKDLDFLVEKMKKMPSFKHQIKKANKEEYFKAQYTKIANKLNEPIETYRCYILLNEMMTAVTDIHATVASNISYLKVEDLENENVMDSFITSETFKSHPRATKDIAALQTKLALKPAENLEGIYYYKDHCCPIKI